MTRMHKKCLIASTGMHVFLALLLVFGSAFFVAKERPITQPKLQFVPSRFIEAALAGGGGNPNIARTDDVQKGQLTAPIPVTPPKQIPQPRPPEPTPPPAAAKPEPKPVDTKPDPKVEPVKPSKTKTADVATPTDKPVVKPRITLADLKPIGPSEAEKAKAKADAEAREASRKAAQAARQKLADQIGKAAETMQRGFQGGTKVDVGGPGGEAFANYGALVQAAYADAWKIIQDLSDDDSVALVRVIVARDGRVISSQIIRKSGNATMDRSVQRALDRVRDEGLPRFPDFIKELERSFTIEFNLKTRRLLG